MNVQTAISCCFLIVIYLMENRGTFAAGSPYKLYPNYDYRDVKVMDYKFINTLKCNVSGPVSNDLYVQWRRDDIVIESSDKYELKSGNLLVHKTQEADLTKYSCFLVNRTDKSTLIRADFETQGKPTAKIVQKIPQGAFIEGQKIVLDCVVQGKPVAEVEWRFGNITFPMIPKESSEDVSTEDIKKERITTYRTSDSILTLTIKEALMTDRGEYYCRVTNDVSKTLNLTIEATVFLRIKDKLAALWPFIGICAEVVVLCAIILVYERNRMKSELEESDTDISPEQKNTPDHGKDSVRQRK